MTPHQQLTIAALNALPKELRNSSRSSLLVGVARHLREDLGVAVDVFQAAVGNSRRQAGTEYLLVDGLRISRWGEIGDRPIMRGAWLRAQMDRPPTTFLFSPYPVEDPPEYFNETETQHAQAVRAWLRKQALTEQVAQDMPELPIMAYARECLRVIREEGDGTLMNHAVLIGVARHLKKDRGVEADVFDMGVRAANGATLRMAYLFIEEEMMDREGRTDFQAMSQALFDHFSLGMGEPPFQQLGMRALDGRSVGAEVLAQARQVHLKLKLAPPGLVPERPTPPVRVPRM